MAGTDISDTPLTGGQNEGIDRTVLPLPQLSVAQNVRMRKGSRWGKRFGHAALSLANLGTGTGNIRCVAGGAAGGFAVVDDRCCNYNQTSATFVAPTSLTAPNLFGSYVNNPRIAGAVSGWLPDTSFFPVPPRSSQRQTTTPCSNCFALGYLWTAIQFGDPVNATDTLIRVVATDPTDQTVVFMQEIAPTNIGFGGVTYPKLITSGATVVLTYAYAQAAGVLNINARSLTTLAGGFGADTTLANSAGIATYDAAPYSATQFLLVYTRPAATLEVRLFDTATFGISVARSVTDSSANPITTASIVGSATNAIYVGYGVAAITSTKVLVYPAGLGAATGTATISAATSVRPQLALLTSSVRAVFDTITSTGNLPHFRFRDVSNAAALVTAYSMTQYSAYPISIPFVIGTSVYLWTTNFFNNAFGYANLIRLPAPTDFATVSGGPITCPVEMSVQDYLVSSGNSMVNPDLRGIPTVAQIGATAAYAVTVPTLFSVPDISIAFGHEFRVIQAKHYTDTSPYRSVLALPVDLANFLPMGALTRVDDRGAVEEGFIYSPTLFSLAPAGGGSMTASSDYYYTAVFKSRGANGRLEQSSPAIPVKVTMGVGQGTVSMFISTLDLTARSQLQIDIYRSLSNTQTFYYLTSIDGGASPAGVGNVSFTDAQADTSISTHAALYIQQGQTLANAFPPAARFGCVGGQRLFLGGLIRPDIVQASKLIFGDQSPTFADQDGFRIVLPAPCTGTAWMDSLCLFTGAGIYVVSGDGPDDSGSGDFGNLVQMPYAIGCIESRSVVTIDDGTFFQSLRTLYMLPRGFGAPVPAGDVVMDTLAAFPVITGTAVVTKGTEQTVHWTCSDAAGTFGRRIVYDIAHKVWSVDSIASIPLCGTGQWLNNEVAVFSGNIADGNALQASNGSYADSGQTVTMALETGDLRPFGLASEGVISKVDMLAEVRTACTLNVTKRTENGVSPVSMRVFALAGSDYNIGQVSITETWLGSAELRDVSQLRMRYEETSTVEGLAFIALAIEHEQAQGLKRVSDLSRGT